jgi:hypothetical protein
MARTAGQALFSGCAVVFALLCLVCSYLAFVMGAGVPVAGLVVLAIVSAVAAWVCDSTRDRTSHVARDRLNHE